MNKLCWILPLGLLVGVNLARAQEEAPPKNLKIPASPALPVAWKVTIKDVKAGVQKPDNPATASELAIAQLGNPAQRDPGDVKTVEVVLDVKKRHETYAWSKGAVTSRWVVDRFQLLESPYEKQLSRIEASGGLSSENYLKGPFPEFGWVNHRDFAGTLVIGDHKCWVFRSKPPATEVNSAAPDFSPGLEPYSVVPNFAGSSEWIAYIDKETLLPVELKTGARQYTYEFHEVDPSKLVMGANFDEELKKWIGDIRKSTIVPPRG